ncbi:rRNA methylase [Nostoc sp. T09]|uniref:TrmH family RNA methyltransferase n=1 Tax=Nostoc sp. T09 TaxID=1932621 RepID=UPI000A3A9087|nr:RNA methyltransferase [Nostoc sp. T09]OUL23659.1 rRNA methylase [Nostoc sp. T09]
MAGVKNSSHERLDVEATLTEVEKLQFDRAHRHASGLFYVEGVRNFVKAIDNGFDISAIVFSEKLLTAPLARKLVRKSRRAGVPCISVTPEQFRRVSQTERASGIGAIAHQRWFNLHDISPQAGLCWVALQTVRSPGNLGTLIRTSDAVGGAGFIFIGGSVDPFDPDVVRASMGSLFHQKFVRTSLSALRHWVRHQDCSTIGASPDGMADFHQFNYPQSTLLFLGEERQGLTSQQRDLCQHLVRIPMVGAVDSLNLAVAGSLLMYEIYKSRTSSIPIHS